MISTRASHSFKVVTSLRLIRRHLSLDAIHLQNPTESGPAAPTPNRSRESQPTLPVVVLKRSRQSKAFRNGNPLVFTRAIQSVPSNVQQGQLVLVGVEQEGSDKKANGKRNDSVAAPASSSSTTTTTSTRDSSSTVALGFGVYNPNSLYRVRILCHRQLQPDLYRTVQDRLMAAATTTSSAFSDEAEDQDDNLLALILQHHIQTCLHKRLTLNLPNEDTDVFRLVNGEGDSLSGLAIDVLGVRPVHDSTGNDDGDGVLPYRDAAAVIMSSAAWCQIHQPIIEATVLQALPGLQTLVWKTTESRLVQDGYSAATSLERRYSTAADDNDNYRAVVVRENGVLFQTFPFASGQKTGVYCDQRENRQNLALLCRNKRVLDLCCYHGGFALYALLHGPAASATAVDSSQDAIATCMENARLNGCDDKLECVAADITTFLQNSHGKREYDVVVLDPPKLAPTTASLDKARRKYHGLNRDAIKVVAAEGGLLLTCSCSAAMTQKDGGQYFLEMVSGAALAAGRGITLLRVSGAAACHTQSPVAWPAGSYLTAALFYVHPTEL